MEAGTQVWSYAGSSLDPWIISEIISLSPGSVTLKHLVGATAGRIFSRPLLPPSSSGEGAKYEGVEIANAPLSKADILAGADNDMITLQHLHEPAILQAVSERYFRGEIYTWTGPILIAVNPFQRLPLYTREILQTYREEGLLRSQNLDSESGNKKSLLGPHVFSVADRSYRQMMSEQRKSQSILISGESGAGKTETTKIVMLYLTKLGTAVTAGNSNGGDENQELSMMERVMQSNPILEAFGNAKTLRNDNSSRFGKFIELGFDRSGTLLGARVHTYLLEKVRIGFHASGERNYHIFYQLLRGGDEWHDRYCFSDGLGLEVGTDLATCFRLTRQGGAPQLREFGDHEGWELTLKSMRSMGWNEEKIDQVLSVVAGILHLGQVKFESIMSEGGQMVAKIADANTLANAAKLLGVDLEKLITALTVRIMVTRGDEIRIDLAPHNAADARDALAKTIYGAMFLWVVREVNNCIKWENDSFICSSVGVLDIFGFESFAVNSFEQLCINFTNEALQQQFNKFIFKLEQEEYEREHISWAFIEFPDNQDCLDTIQARPKGILAMLDDECKLGQRGQDRNWAKRLNEAYLPNKNQVISQNTRYSANKMQQAKGIFCVRHFAGNVEYTADTNFLEKNRDEIPLTAMSLFGEDSSNLIREIYSVQKDQSEDKAGARKGNPAKRKTVSQQFRAQLNSLIDMIETTDPHYIRCLKPNDEAKPLRMNRQRLTEQLRYGGVLEAVRVARAGFPSRRDHTGFFKRYRMLLPSVPDKLLPWSMEGKEPYTLCVKLLDILLKEGANPVHSNSHGLMSHTKKIQMALGQPEPLYFHESDVQFGLSKVFMRKGPHDKLENLRVFHRSVSVTLIQSRIRGMQQERRYLVMRDAAVTIERCCRGFLGRARWKRLHEAQAGLLLAKNFIMYIKRRKYNRARLGAVRLQARFRGSAIRKFNAEELAEREKENTKMVDNDPSLHKGNKTLRSRGNRNPLQENQDFRGSSFSKNAFSAERCLDAVIVGRTITEEAWAHHRSKVTRLEEQVALLAEEKEKIFQEQEQAAMAAKKARDAEAVSADAAHKKQRCKSRGMYAFLTILLSTVAILGGMIGITNSRSNDSNGDEEYLRGSGSFVNNESTMEPSSTLTRSNTQRPSSTPTQPNTQEPSSTPSQMPSSTPSLPLHLTLTEGIDLSCLSNTKRFDLTVELGPNPSEINWVIFELCTLETYYNCSKCYADSQPNFPTHFTGCLPRSNDSTGRNLEYALEMNLASEFVENDDGGSATSYWFEMRYDGMVVASTDYPTQKLQSVYFGEGSGCSASPSMSRHPAKSPSKEPSLLPTTTAYPSFSPTMTSQPSTTPRRLCSPRWPGAQCPSRCIVLGENCCCCWVEGTIAEFGICARSLPP